MEQWTTGAAGQPSVWVTKFEMISEEQRTWVAPRECQVS